ncbi:hypothetical protein JTB14_022458 [Gonioctena quinquepunctata]|nr:hypothetical protein JTB14_022458 [Gonioctena quinquepunctata]
MRFPLFQMSTNEHLPPPPKSRISPLEFRNTDLVSRLLAATPPYLYNMSLLPNTYFFSEMLRSLVHAKTERSSQMHPPVRRSRKRNWTTSRSECFVKTVEPKSEEMQDTSTDWMLKSNNKKIDDNPLELTINKTENYEGIFQNNTNAEPIMPDQFPNIHPNIPQDGNVQSLVLPPPPPMWYPPLYPTPPYGIDPLHFFIDLRVSGHIYDRKNRKESGSPTESFSSVIAKDKLPHTEVSNVKNETEVGNNIFKQPRHCSAFSVPTPNGNKSMNSTTLVDREIRSTKFDVKSMGFDKEPNKTSTTYILSNLTSIYKNISKIEEGRDGKNVSENMDETEEQREKRVKDLRALIGLELVVDYMKHKPAKIDNDDSVSSTDVESIGSPALEVVALHDEN